MSKGLIAFLVFVFATVPINLDWISSKNGEFQITFSGEKDPCKKKLRKYGRKIEYNFLLEGCVKSGWFGPKCGQTIINTNKIRIDPLTQNYKVTKDRVDDDFEPISATFSDLEEAVKSAYKVESVTSEAIRARSPGVDFTSNKAFLRARVVIECKNTLRETLSWLPYVLTLGIVEREDYDSGWFDFRFE